MIGTHPLLIYANDVNLLTESMETIREKTQPLLIDCKQIGHATDAEKAKYTFMSRQKNAGQNNNIKIGNKFLVGVPSSNTEEPTNKNCVNEDIWAHFIRGMPATIRSRNFCITY